MSESHFLDALGRRQQQRWVDAHQRREAAKAAWFARPGEAVAADLARLDELLFTRARWKFAATMPDNPHSYTLRKQWAREWSDGERDFQWTVAVIRLTGVRQKYPPEGRLARWYCVLHLRDAMFWPMNYDIDATVLINRKPSSLATDRQD